MLETLEGLGGVAQFEEKPGALEEAAFVKGIFRSRTRGHDRLEFGEGFFALGGELEAAGVIETCLNDCFRIGEFVFGYLEVGEGVAVVFFIETQHGKTVGGGPDEDAAAVGVDEVVESSGRVLKLIHFQVALTETEPGGLEIGTIWLLADEDLVLLGGESELLFAVEEVGVGEDVFEDGGGLWDGGGHGWSRSGRCWSGRCRSESG